MTLESRARVLRRVGTIAIVLAVLTMAMGSWTKATGSGLSCPDWPQCYGKWLPPFPSYESGGEKPGYDPANDTADQYQEWQIMSEWSHRLLASFLGVPILVFAVLAVTTRGLAPSLRASGGMALLLLLVQGGLGGATVMLGNADWITTLHLVTATLFIVLLTVATSIAYLRPFAPEPPKGEGEPPKPKRFVGYSYSDSTPSPPAPLAGDES